MKDTTKSIIELSIFAAFNFISFLANAMVGGFNLSIAALNLYVFIKLILGIKNIVTGIWY